MPLHIASSAETQRSIEDCTMSRSRRWKEMRDDPLNMFIWGSWCFFLVDLPWPANSLWRRITTLADGKSSYSLLDSTPGCYFFWRFFDSIFWNIDHFCFVFERFWGSFFWAAVVLCYFWRNFWCACVLWECALDCVQSWDIDEWKLTLGLFLERLHCPRFVLVLASCCFCNDGGNLAHYVQLYSAKKSMWVSVC